MTLLTRTGLLEGRRRPVDRRGQSKEAQVDVAPLCQAAPYSLRPLAALLNPYARGCSVLCNHPADTQSRDAVRRAKETWPTDRVLVGEDALPEELFRRYTDTDSRPHSPPHHEDHHVGHHHHAHAPPPTLMAPPPTAGARRCRTPDPYHPFHLDLQQHQLQLQPGQPQRTLLVLDLRRSRSHDTLSVAAASESGIWPPPAPVLQPAPSMLVSPPSPSEALAGRRPGVPGYPLGHQHQPPAPPNPSAPGQRRTPRTPCPSLAASRPTSQATCRASSRAGSRLARPSSQPSSPSPGSDSRRGRGKLQTAASVGGELMMEQPPLAALAALALPLPGADSTPDVVVTCADDSLSRAEEEVVRRRGKKRRGKKSGKDGLRELEKEIHGFPEPGETQVSAIGDESHNPSARPSLTGACLLASGGSMGAAYGQGVAAARAAAQEAARLRAVARSFLDTDSITHLQRDLDLETVECEFDEKRRIALEEAFRLLPSHAKRRVRGLARAEEAARGAGAANAAGVVAEAPDEDAAACGARGGLLGVPRVFSLRSARFELPLNSAALNSLTPMEYVSRHVEVCGSSAQLYRRVFNLHREGVHVHGEGGGPGPAAIAVLPEPPQPQPESSQLQPPPDVLIDLDDEPRYLRGERVVAALGDVLGRPLTGKEAEVLRERLGWEDGERLGFRTWCGVSALAERLFLYAFSQRQSPDVADLRLRGRVGGAEPPARPELEQADLAGLRRRLARLNPDPRLVTILLEMSEL